MAGYFRSSRLNCYTTLKVPKHPRGIYQNIRRCTWTDVAAACFPPFTSPPSLSTVYNSQTSTLFRHTSLPVTSSLHCSLILHCLDKCEIPPRFLLEVWFTRTGFDELTPTSSLSHPHFLPSQLDGEQALCLTLCFLHTGQSIKLNRDITEHIRICFSELWRPAWHCDWRWGERIISSPYFHLLINALTHR